MTQNRGFLTEGPQKDGITHLNSAHGVSGSDIKQHASSFFLRVLHKILNTCLMKSNKKFPPSFSLCNYVIWRQVYAFGSLLFIAQFEGNGFCLMAYATAYVCVHMHSFCFFSLLLVCVLCVTRHYLHTLFLISHFTRFLSSAGNRKMKKQAAAVDESEIEK